MKRLDLAILPAVGSMFLCIALGIWAYVPERTIKAGFEDIFNTAKTTALIVTALTGLVAAAALTIGLSFLTWWVWQHALMLWSERQIKKAEALERMRKAKIEIFIAPAGSQVIAARIDELMDVFIDPLHLAATRINGLLAKPSARELAQWAFFQEHQSINKPPKIINAPAEVPQIEGPLTPILPLLSQSQRVILAGGSNSGKTTLTKHLIAVRSEDSKIVVIDPHSPSKILGIDVIGAGRNYGAIGKSLESLVLLMQERYEDVAKGVFGYLEHPRVSVFIDEWTSIAEEVDHAGRILKTLLTESRKVNIHLVLLTHSTTIPVLGLPDAQIKKSAMIVELTGGNGSPYRAFVQPATRTTPDGKKATPVEYALPGPFTGYAQPDTRQLILDLPDPRLVRLRQMAAEGKKPTALAKEYFGVDKPNSRQIEAVMKILEENSNDK